jgi:hypothetical protein
MRAPWLRRFLPAVAFFLAVACWGPSATLAASPLAASATLPPGVGLSPTNAIPLTGIIRDELYPGGSEWYQATLTGSPPWSVTLDYDPANATGPAPVAMRVNWTNGGMPFVDWPGYYRIGEGTPSGYGPGVLYWQSSDPSGRTYAIDVVNTSTKPVGFAIAVTSGDPPFLNPPPPVEFLPPLE